MHLTISFGLEENKIFLPQSPSKPQQAMASKAEPGAGPSDVKGKNVERGGSTKTRPARSVKKQADQVKAGALPFACDVVQVDGKVMPQPNCNIILLQGRARTHVHSYHSCVHMYTVQCSNLDDSTFHAPHRPSLDTQQNSTQQCRCGCWMHEIHTRAHTRTHSLQASASAVATVRAHFFRIATGTGPFLDKKQQDPGCPVKGKFCRRFLVWVGASPHHCP